MATETKQNETHRKIIDIIANFIVNFPTLSHALIEQLRKTLDTLNTEEVQLVIEAYTEYFMSLKLNNLNQFLMNTSTKISAYGPNSPERIQTLRELSTLRQNMLTVFRRYEESTEEEKRINMNNLAHAFVTFFLLKNMDIPKQPKQVDSTAIKKSEAVYS